jgi:hypothetical protein
MLRVFALIFFFLGTYASADEKRIYLSPDKTLKAVVIPVGKVEFEKRENRVEIRDSEGKILLTKSFASDDGEHGYIVSHAAWTPDSQFFVFSVYSSGGHQPWSSPTYFYCRSDRQLRLLDDYLGPVTDPNFELSAPDVIRTSKLKAFGDIKSVAVEAKLSNLLKQKPKR